MPRVIVEMNQDLLKPFNKMDVDVTLGQMHLVKTPRLDEMPTLFYQIFCKVVRKNVSYVVLDMLNNDTSLEGMNHTLISRILKWIFQRICLNLGL